MTTNRHIDITIEKKTNFSPFEDVLKSSNAKSAKDRLKRNCHQLEIVVSPLRWRARALNNAFYFFTSIHFTLNEMQEAETKPTHIILKTLPISFDKSANFKWITSTGMSIFAKLKNVLVLNKILTAKTAFSNHKRAHLSHSGVDRTFCYALSSYWRHAVSRKWHGHWITKLWMCVSQLKLHRTKLCEIILNIYQLIRWKKRECFYRRRSVVAPKKDLVLNK